MKSYSLFIKSIPIASAFLLFACSTSTTNTDSPKNNNASTEVSEMTIDSVKSYVLNAKNILSTNLIRAIGEKGSAGAVEFCHTRAMEITDSISAVEPIKIYRRSDKQRNPVNKASASQVQLMETWKEQLQANQKLKPVKSGTNPTVYYFPIVTEPLCMQCHGEKKDLAPDVLNALERYYPDDQATGYKTGELRGMWVVEPD